MIVRRLNTLIAAVLLAGAVGPAAARGDAPEFAATGEAYVEGEVIVGFESGGSRVVEVPPRTSVPEAVARLERRPGVAYAVPNWIAYAAHAPLDRGTSGEPGGWRADQWNFLGPPGGIRTVPAWRRLARKTDGAGAANTTVAVVDTGIAYAPVDGIGAAPDFDPAQFVPGIDLVDGDSMPLDTNGHGTHVAATIGEQVTYGTPAKGDDYLTGIAYGVKLMPVRVLDKRGAGSAENVAAGIKWAARNGADIINLSLQFDPAVDSCSLVPTVCSAIKRAWRRGALVVGAAGNAPATETGKPRALFPGAAPKVLAVGSTTEHGCLADYSHFRKRVDLLAPGGGEPRQAATRRECADDYRPIMQLSFECFPRCTPALGPFAIRPDIGTSMSAAHVSGVAAVVRSTRVVGRNPRPRRLAKQLTCTTRKLKPRRFHGRGIVDAANATRKRVRKC